MTSRRWAAVLGAVGIALGAFGAHGLEDHVNADRLETWETASRYHLLHAVAMLALPDDARGTRLLWLAGVALFSGSLYALVLLDLPVLGAITPLGGLSFIAGWAWLGWRATSGPPTA